MLDTQGRSTQRPHSQGAPRQIACCRRASPPSRDRSAMRSTAYSNLIEAGVEAAQVSTQCVSAAAERRNVHKEARQGTRMCKVGQRQARTGWLAQKAHAVGRIPTNGPYLGSAAVMRPCSNSATPWLYDACRREGRQASAEHNTSQPSAERSSLWVCQHGP